MPKKPVKKADIFADKSGSKTPPRRKRAPRPVDRGEAVSAMEPMLISESSRHRAELSDKVMSLTMRSASFRSALPNGLIEPLASLVREMNCYYSNLIEGHNTHPIDIQRALFGQESSDPKTRDLQKEAIAHISVQKWIDEGGLQASAGTCDAVYEIHRRFYEVLPESLKWAENPETGEREPVIPGKARKRTVSVGTHVPISEGAVERHMLHWERCYGKLGSFEIVLNAAAAHHRLLWIHPFLDGNGRVARLISYAMLRDALDTSGLWSVSRGLARNSATYKQHLMACDLKRRNDLDGRGSLSEEALVEFTRFFLDNCLDQVDFMQKLMRPNELRLRIMTWADEEARVKNLSDKAKLVLDHILFNGSIARSDLRTVLGVDARHARRIMQPLIKVGIIRALDNRAPYELTFPAALAHRLMPGLYPGTAEMR